MIKGIQRSSLASKNKQPIQSVNENEFTLIESWLRNMLEPSRAVLELEAEPSESFKACSMSTTVADTSCSPVQNHQDILQLGG
jgi:hypothetical protein